MASYMIPYLQTHCKYKKVDFILTGLSCHLIVD